MLLDPKAAFADAARDYCYEVAEEILAEIKAAPAPPYRRTGDLRKSFTVHKRGRGATVRTNSDHFWYVEYGTRHMAATPLVTPAVGRVRARRMV
jgi:hypothetical protein